MFLAGTPQASPTNAAVIGCRARTGRGGLPGGIPIFRGDDPIDPRLDFGVVEDNGRRVAAQLQRGLLTVPAYYCISKCPASAECAVSKSA
jgi:hypothetical protein